MHSPIPVRARSLPLRPCPLGRPGPVGYSLFLVFSPAFFPPVKSNAMSCELWEWRLAHVPLVQPPSTSAPLAGTLVARVHPNNFPPQAPTTTVCMCYPSDIASAGSVNAVRPVCSWLLVPWVHWKFYYVFLQLNRSMYNGPSAPYTPQLVRPRCTVQHVEAHVRATSAACSSMPTQGLPILFDYSHMSSYGPPITSTFHTITGPHWAKPVFEARNNGMPQLDIGHTCLHWSHMPPRELDHTCTHVSLVRNACT